MTIELPSAAPPDPTANLRISWSRLRTHDECPAKGELQRRHKTTVQDHRPFFHGNVPDLAMRTWLGMDRGDGQPPAGWMAAHIEEIFAECERSVKEDEGGIIRWKGGRDKGETLEFCRELVTRLEPILAKYCLPYDWRPAWRFEVPFTVKYPGGGTRRIALVGETDLLVFGPGGKIAVWDLKATKNNEYYRKVAGQLAFYNLAIRCAPAALHPKLGRWPARSGLIQPMCTERVKPLPVLQEAVRDIARRIETVAWAIWEGKLPPKAEDVFCSNCEVRHACPKFRPAAGSGSRHLVEVPG